MSYINTKIYLVVVGSCCLCLLSSCCIQCNMGPVQQFFKGFWKLKEIQQTDGKIIKSISDQYFYNEWYGDVNPGKPTPLAKDSIVFYTNKIPVKATAVTKIIESNDKQQKVVSLLDDGTFISIQFFSDQIATNVYLEIIRANTLDSLSKSPIERYKPVDVKRVW
jgi:hypothetical protein